MSDESSQERPPMGRQPTKCDCDERIGERCPHPKHDEDTIALVSQGKYVFTEAQIDAAWAHWTTYGSADVRNALAELGIEQCEGYGRKDGHVLGVKCPTCNGHGWRKE